MPFAIQPVALHPLLPAISALALAICGLTLFVAATVVHFSRRYMRADLRKGAYFTTIGALVGCVLAFVATGNLVLFALAWVGSGVALARLIGHAGQLGDARQAMRRAAFTFAMGDAALLAALVILAWHGGAWQIDSALAALPTMPVPFALLVALLLVVAAAARCALPPFSGWLLSSMTAPTPVSALMHAGLVNAGGFLLIRFAAVLEMAPLARIAAVAVGLVAALYGIGIMAVRPDIKRSLAGSTVSQMGFMILSCGLGAYTAALWHILAHGLFKAWLFLGSGSNLGTKAGGPVRNNGALPPVAIAATTLGVAFVAAWLGILTATMVPLALAFAAAIATLSGALQGGGSARDKGLLALFCAGLVALYAGALWITHTALGPDGPALLPAPALLGLLAGFLGTWIVQQRLLAGAMPIPPALYVYLLNAGALASSATGANP